jgi:hypothetical protein
VIKIPGETDTLNASGDISLHSKTAFTTKNREATMTTHKHTGRHKDQDARLMTGSFPFVPSALGTLIPTGDGTWTFSPNSRFERIQDDGPLVNVCRVSTGNSPAVWAGPRCLLIWAPCGWKFADGHIVGAADDECLWWVEPRAISSGRSGTLMGDASCASDGKPEEGMEDWSSWGEALRPYIDGADRQ